MLTNGVGGLGRRSAHQLSCADVKKFLDIGEKHLEALNAPQELLLKMENSTHLSLMCL